MDEAKAQRYLAQIDENIDKGEARVRNHQARMKKLAALGCDTVAGQDTLATLKKLVRTMRDVRKQFQRLAK